MSEQRENVSMEKFISTWERVIGDGGNADDVAAELGLKRATVEQRATSYRTKRGIPLSKVTKGAGRAFDQAGALALLAEIRGCTVEELAGEQSESESPVETEAETYE